MPYDVVSPAILLTQDIFDVWLIYDQLVVIN